MQCINKLGSTWPFGHPVKNKAMSYVFKKCPEEHTAKKYQQNCFGAKIILGSGQINQVAEDGNIHTPDNQWMRLGKCFQKIVFKQTGLPLIVYFFEMHGAKIRSGKLQEIIRQILYSF